MAAKQPLQGKPTALPGPVLCDGFDTVAEIHYGRSEADAPDVDGRVYFKAKKRVAPGSFVKVKITEALDYDVIGAVVE